MNNDFQIRNLYRPCHPTARIASDEVSYTEFLPDPRLQKFIFSYWEFKTTHKLGDGFDYKVVPNGCIDIFFELNDPQENFVTGFSNRYSKLRLNDSFRYIGICFLPTMITQIYNVKASELSNSFEKLSDVVPETSRFIADRFIPQQGITEIKELLDGHFLRLVSSTDFNSDKRLYEALHMILKNAGTLNVETDLNTGISPRQLRRLFDFYIGDTPKTFSRVIRFQNILAAKPSRQSLKENHLFLDAGYFDQAHFIKDFKSFYGETPGKVFDR